MAEFLRPIARIRLAGAALLAAQCRNMVSHYVTIGAITGAPEDKPCSCSSRSATADEWRKTCRGQTAHRLTHVRFH